MLNITSRGNYGLQAMVELALHFNQGVLQVSDISNRANIPKNYLEQLLNTLKKSGLIHSLRGNKGGYKLALHPEQISVNDILHSLEGAESLAEAYQKNDAIKKYYQKAETALKDIFNVTLDELAREQTLIDKQLTFYI